MAKHPTLIQHFRSFAYQNHIKDFDKALEYFTVFGGTGWDIDTSKSIESLIREKILHNYEALHKSITRYTHNNPVYHKLLSLVALGTEYEQDAFKKAKIGRDRGEEAMDYLEQKSLLKFDLSIEKPLDANYVKSDRVIFPLPFMRFWFAMISPNYKSILEGDFDEFTQKWQKLRGNFSILLSNLLVRDLVMRSFAKAFADDPISSLGSYYDKHTHIEILAIRKSGKMLAGACKYSKEPAKSNMPNALKQKCQKSELNVSDYVLFSKNGFSSEVADNKDANMTLLLGEHQASLLDDLNKDDLLVYSNRKY